MHTPGFKKAEGVWIQVDAVVITLVRQLCTDTPRMKPALFAMKDDISL
jgi:hypothetical protein